MSRARGAVRRLVLACAVGLVATALAVRAVVAGVAGEEAALARYDFDAPPADRWKLPKELNEISGLAADRAGRVFAHGDERAIVYQLDPATHRVVKRFTLGRPAVRGDFEGIALADGRVFLLTSDGVLYAAPEGRDGDAVAFVTYDTGIGRSCEVEGLAWIERDRTFLVACKLPRVAALRGSLTVFAWSLDRRALAPAPTLRVPLARVASLLGEAAIHPSELTRDPTTGHLLLLAARAHAVAELTPAGAVVRVARLRRSLHRQAEGLTVMPDRTLLVADEANGDRATLTSYRAAR